MRKARAFLLRELFAVFPIVIMIPVKTYYGLKWVFKGKTRKLYVKYYRLGVSVNFSVIFLNSMIAAVNFDLKLAFYI